MTLITAESCRANNNGSNGQVFPGSTDGRLAFIKGTTGSVGSNSRFPSNSWHVTLGADYSAARKNFPTPLGTCIFGFAYSPGGFGRPGNLVCIGTNGNGDASLSGANNNGPNLYMTGVQTFDVRNGATVLSSFNLGGAATWYYIEMKTIYSATVGTIEVRVDGVVIYSGTGLNTTGAGVYNHLFWGAGTSPANTPDFSITDIYVCDAVGPTNNDYLGNIRVESITPNGAGTTQQWTPSTGTDHAAVLAQYVNSGDTNYVSSNVVGAKETVAMSDLVSTSGTVRGVVQYTSARRASGVLRAVRAVAVSGGVTQPGSRLATDGTMRTFTSAYQTDPATDDPWTVASVNALQLGALVDSDTFNFSDDFNRPDSTARVGGGWLTTRRNAATGAAYGLDGGKAYASSAPATGGGTVNDALLLRPNLGRDFDMSVTVSNFGGAFASGAPIFAFRVNLAENDGANGMSYWVMFRSDVTFLAPNSGGGGGVNLSNAFTFNNGDRARLVGVGSSYTIFKNGSQVAAFGTPSNSSATTPYSYGLSSYANGFGTTRFDDFTLSVL